MDATGYLHTPTARTADEHDALEPWRKAYWLAADDLDANGWLQGFWGDKDGPHCLLGVISKYAPMGKWQDLLRGLASQIGVKDDGSGSLLIKWNNDPVRTKDEVVSALRSAARSCATDPTR